MSLTAFGGLVPESIGTGTYVSAEPASISANRGSVTATLDAEEAVELVKVLCGIRGSQQVVPILRDVPAIASLLIEALWPIQSRFGLDSQVVLVPFTDPDSDSPVQLFAEIHTTLPVDDAMQKLQEFDREWFLPRLGETSNRFNFALAFQ